MCIYTLINLPGVWNDNSLGKSTVATPAKPQPIQCLILAFAGTYENIHRNTHTKKNRSNLANQTLQVYSAFKNITRQPNS